MRRMRRIDEPSMSDKTLLLSVEDLINRALGPVNCNVVHYKLVQTILHIIARQMRLLEQLVEIKMSDLEEMEEARKEGKKERKPSPPKAKPDKTKKSPKEPEKSPKEPEKSPKEPEKAEKPAAKEKEKVEKERGKSKERTKAKESETSIAISEVKRQKEKVLVVEKGPATKPDRRDSIAVVTRSEFELVKSMVKDLQMRSGPPPAPAMPSNKQLRSDIAKGSASLTDTMEAMQLTARMRAAEQAISQMGDMLTQLAASGALPRELSQQIEEASRKPKMSIVAQKTVAIDPATLEEADGRDGKGVPSKFSMTASRASIRSSMASRASMQAMPGVTHPEMEVALTTLKEDLMKQAQNMTIKANAVAENANLTAKGVADKINIAIELSARISTLNSLVTDYADQLSGLDTGLTTQMTSFRDQINQMRAELEAGLAQLALVNNNAETAAVMELTERYDILAAELNRTLHEHNGLTSLQRQLGDELRSLVECVEMLREQKADRDEVLDGLRDKADLSRLNGLLTALEFAAARAELESRLDVCHDKFSRQESVWMTALKDLLQVTEAKAEVTQLLAARDNAQQKLEELQQMQEHLAMILGEPKAAIIMRALSKGAYCGSCLVPALIEPQDPSFGAPPPLPALRPPPQLEPCVPLGPIRVPPDHREHICNRWVGGSHTLLSAAVTRERAPPPPLPDRPPTRKFTDYGNDGRLYMMEEDMQPCVECNRILNPDGAPVEQGAGDQEKSNPIDDKK